MDAPGSSGWPWTDFPERSVGTTWKLKAPRQRREDGPAAAEVLRPALLRIRKGITDENDHPTTPTAARGEKRLMRRPSAQPLYLH